MIQNWVKRVLGRRHQLAPEEVAYRRVSAKGFCPGGIVDVGAYEGNWTRTARRVFPGTPILMAEAQEAKAPLLKKVADELGNVRVAQAVLARAAGEERVFYEMETGSSLLPEQSNVRRRERRLITQTLDTVAADLPGPLFLKIDVQGAELEVLEGGQQTLARAELVQLEVAFLPYNAGAPTIVEVVDYMHERGFVPYDLAGEVRPNFDDLVQVDLLFVPESSRLRPRHFEF